MIGQQISAQRKSLQHLLEALRKAGYGIRTRGLNFGKVACYRYTKPACHFLTQGSIDDPSQKVKGF